MTDQVNSIAKRDHSRSTQRHLAELPVKVECGPVSGNAVIKNLSRHGAQLHGSFHLMKTLLPNVERPTPRQPKTVRLLFTLPALSEEGLLSIELECHLVYVRRLAQDNFLLGCNIHRFIGSCEPTFRQYLQQLEQAAP